MCITSIQVSCGSPPNSPDEKVSDSDSEDTGSSPDSDSNSESGAKDNTEENDGDKTSEPDPLTFEISNTAKHEWDGSSDKVLEVTLKAGIFALTGTYNGDGNFSATLQNTKGEFLDLLINEIGPYVGEVMADIPEAGKYILDVKADDGDWILKTLSPKASSKLPSEVVGTMDTVSNTFPLKEDTLYKFKAKFTGEGNFSATLRNAKTGEFEDLLFNEIGDYSGETTASVDKEGVFILQIQSFDGAFSINSSIIQ